MTLEIPPLINPNFWQKKLAWRKHFMSSMTRGDLRTGFDAYKFDIEEGNILSTNQ